MSASSFLGLAGSIFGLLGLVGGAVAFLAAMRQKTTIQVLETDNKARGELMATLVEAEKDCKVRLGAAEMRVQVLTDTVTNASAVAELLARVDLLSTEVKGNFAEILRRLQAKGASS